MRICYKQRKVAHMGHRWLIGATGGSYGPPVAHMGHRFAHSGHRWPIWATEKNFNQSAVFAHMGHSRESTGKSIYPEMMFAKKGCLRSSFSWDIFIQDHACSIHGSKALGPGILNQ